MFCTNCGRQIDDDAIYCNYCGERILVEEKVEEKVEELKSSIIKDVDISKKSMELCILLLIIGSIASVVNIIRFYILGKDVNYIFGQTIFMLAFIVSTILLWRSKKIGSSILISFVLFKMISSIYYYLETANGYFIKNLIADEIFYMIIISLLVISWKNDVITRWMR